MKILLLSRYSTLGASSRYRSYQFLPYLNDQGLNITVNALFDNIYLEKFYSLHDKKKLLPKIASSYFRRITILIKTQINKRKFDLIWIEKELLPWIPSWFETNILNTKVPYIVDYDDAIFHRYDQHKSRIIQRIFGKKIDYLMINASLVIAGNKYIANRAKKVGSKYVEIIPTVVDLSRYKLKPHSHNLENRQFTLGWIGTPYTSKYLKEIQSPLQKLCHTHNVKLLTIGSGKLDLDGVSTEVLPWSRETEVESLQKIDVGLMPLNDSPFERGKCGLKLIQYMACARPVVGSPIGVNQQLIENGETGFQAMSIEEWCTALTKLADDPVLRGKMGRKARQNVESNYSLQVMAPQLTQLIKQVIFDTKQNS